MACPRNTNINVLHIGNWRNVKWQKVFFPIDDVVPEGYEHRIECGQQLVQNNIWNSKTTSAISWLLSQQNWILRKVKQSGSGLQIYKSIG